MNVNIENVVHKYVSDFNPMRPAANGWKKQNTDYFKFIDVGNKKVFVKRFDKDKNYIGGFDFLIQIKNKKLPGLPITYDLVSQTENKKTVYYLFQESLEGDTLEDVIRKKVLDFNPQKFTLQIYSALKKMSDCGFWFTDFLEKNIFVDKYGNYYLIDLDSVANLSILPNSQHHLLASVSLNYKSAVMTYWYRDIFKYPFPYISKNLRGNTLNFLELFLFIAQVRYYVENIKTCDFFSANARKEVPKYLISKNEVFTIAIFKSCFENTNKHQQILNIELLNSYVNSVLFPERESLKIDFVKKKVIGAKYPQTASAKSDLELENLLRSLDMNFGKRNFKSAKNDIEKIKKIDSNNATAGEYLLKILSIENEDKARIWFSNATSFYESNQFSDARKECNKIKNLYKKNPLDTNLQKISKSADMLLIEIEKEDQQLRDFQLIYIQKQKREEEINSIKDKKKSPYECIHCNFPVIKNEDSEFINGFRSIMALTFIMVLYFSEAGWWSLIGVIPGVIVVNVIAFFLPDSVTKAKIKCKNCRNYYVKVGKEIK